MKLTENQIELIANYTDERYIDRAKLITYLESHKTVEKAVFAACSKVAPSKRLLEANERGYDDLAEYNPVERQTFIRRIPFYFYIPSDLKRGGEDDVGLCESIVDSAENLLAVVADNFHASYAPAERIEVAGNPPRICVGHLPYQ